MDLNKINIPQHVAIIMDGNGRWAKKRFLPRVMGHKKGVETIKKITIRAHQLEIKVLTVYAFSTENWARPEEEVNYLMSLPKDFFDSFMPELMQNNVKVTYIGNADPLPEETKAILDKAIEKTKENTGLILNIALNYGGRQELVEGIKAISQAVLNHDIKPEEINEDLISSTLMTQHLGDFSEPDLMIRTSGELRLSNFLLWQIAYSEFYFTDILWPDFSPADFDQAIEEYSKRQRRFGKI
ncbi:isoprenyl transferase [Facklamia miroungae]|uniref:Isoprenyl transferase n=1 Tax=Facklamia miroungae TaxID=120956 RepID=A0A1G7P3P9_9LACT|nr:isoprenyl transferase [Facklamia miroungae]NKZ28566.1 isoprenyl transferase [Facklamia miroungae]SDF80737.1 undecaprenyl diphosphate synthase [Facklamia miroungae]